MMIERHGLIRRTLIAAALALPIGAAIAAGAPNDAVAGARSR